MQDGVKTLDEAVKVVQMEGQAILDQSIRERDEQKGTGKDSEKGVDNEGGSVGIAK
ncbi:hypothetical protein D3C77_635350 [compost metagenome]